MATLRSATVTHGRNMTRARAWLRAAGVSAAGFGRPSTSPMPTQPITSTVTSIPRAPLRRSLWTMTLIKQDTID
jgi:hypothetical protein